MTPEKAGQLCDRLDQSLRGSEMNLSAMSNMIVVVLREEAWRERRIRTGDVVKHSRFIDFITKPPLEGLGEDPDRIKKLLRDDLEALAAFESAIVGKHGGDHGNQYTSGKFDNIKLATREPETGTSRAYTLRRLSKNYPELFEKVTSGELSVNKAAIKAGFRKQQTPFKQAQKLWAKLSTSERKAFLRWIQDVNGAD